MKKSNKEKKISALASSAMLFAMCIGNQAFATTWIAPVQTHSDQDSRLDRDNDRFDRDGRYDRGDNRFEKDGRRFDRDNRFDRYDDRFEGRNNRFGRMENDSYIQNTCRSPGCMHREFDRPRDFDQRMLYNDGRMIQRDYDRGYNDDRIFGRDPQGAYDRDQRSTLNDQQGLEDKIGKDVHYALQPGYFSKGYEQVSASITNGYVTLAGTVQTQKEKEALDKAIRNINGVRGVENNVRVLNRDSDNSYTTNDQRDDRNTLPATDEQLGQEVHRQLSSGLFTKGYERVTSDVRNGTVTLSGTVDSLKDKDALEKTVRNIDGVRTVNNTVRVEDPRLRA